MFNRVHQKNFLKIFQILNAACVCCDTFSSTVTHDAAVVDPDGPGSLKCSGTFGADDFDGRLEGRFDAI